MRRWWVIATIVAAIIATVALVLLITHPNTDNNTPVAQLTEVEYGGITAEYNGDGVCEVLVELGTVPRSTTTTKRIRIINQSATPLVLVDYSTLCRCMWLEYSREPIPSGEYRDIELIFDSRGEWGSVGNFMEITTSSADTPIVLWIDADVE